MAVLPRNRNLTLTGRLHGTIVGPTGRSDPGYVRLSVRPVGQTGRTDCSRAAHICQSNQCGLLADYIIPHTLQRDWLSDWPVGQTSRTSVHTLRQSDRQSDEIKHV